ncbi:MAG: bifunctional pyr operon transcriptional regulator/uracil phosphoribosyltransferase PyrR [Acidimicrobiia bacterium]
MSSQDIRRSITRISHEIVETHGGADDLVLIGIHTRGVFLAESLSRSIEEFEGSAVPVGALDVAMYRDDRDQRQDIEPKGTKMPDGVSLKKVVIVDDVLYTGRTVRAAMDALADIGRAYVTKLAVLVDRGHRELPIRADYVGKNLPTTREEVVRVRLDVFDGTEGVWIERKAVA